MEASADATAPELVLCGGIEMSDYISPGKYEYEMEEKDGNV